MKITALELVPLRVQQAIGVLEPAWEAGAAMEFARGGGTALEVHTDAGLIGIGPGVKKRVVEAVTPMLLGRDPSEVEQLFEPLRYAMRDQRGAGGVDIALWDLAGKAAGQPLFRLWGGAAARPRVPAYASMIRLSTPSERAEQAAALLQQGWRAIKLRLHHQTLAQDVETVARVRAAVGDRMTILCDANQAQSAGDWQPGVRWDFERALRTARELQQLGCGWLEEPLPRYAWRELRRLAESVELPIAGGENLRLQEWGPLLQERPYDIAQPDALVVDGLTGLRRVFALATQSGIAVAPHHGGRGLGTIAHLHAVASWPQAMFVEVLHDPPIGDCAHGFAMLQSAPQLDADGNLILPTAPGLGVAIDPSLRTA